MPGAEQAKLTVVAEFPEHAFLENLAVRPDGSILVTVMNKKQLWCVPAPGAELPVEPVLVHTFPTMTLFVVETDPDVFLLGASDVYGTREAQLWRLDMGGWSPGGTIVPQLLLTFPEPHVGLNGGCLLARDVLVAAGPIAPGLIWRVDLSRDGASASARPWLQHDSLKNRPGTMKPE